ncbi:MAG: hypothetical protein CVV64_04185 [Candidatus Wallbacteria bacterium HGW-Wallbacteria-1]|jgi:HEAT repeat protein|uniref:HEAT repeat domain-containing protein n=1 Tax=Candidatus Wallbacteria bacterium HGW-Wallbacteria-1 TaxID=2013854 RepID=A0A2N1PRM3_9BACT|nr:MAG: hypothetical protein CVV64_04185 [Candidatus Wallbacteria bacterium HGW-Wallbacteria-1]
MKLELQRARADLRKRDWSVKQKAIDILGDSADQDAITILNEFISTESDRDLVAIAMEALDKIQKALEAQSSRKIALDRGDDGGEEGDGKSGFLESQYSEEVQELVTKLENESSKYVRATLVKEIGKTKDIGLVKVLANYLSDPDTRVVANTIEAMGMMNSPVILSHILPFIDHQNPRIKANVNKILFKFDESLVLDNLRDMIVSTKERTRAAALYALTQNPSPESYEIIVLAKDDPSPALKAKALKAIGSMKAMLFFRSLKDPRKLALFLFVMVGGAFGLYFAVFGVINYVDRNTSGNRFSGVKGSDDEPVVSSGRGRRNTNSPVTFGRRVFQNPRAQSMAVVMDSYYSEMDKFKFQIAEGCARSDIVMADFNQGLADAHALLEQGDLFRAEQKLKEVIDTETNEYVLYDAFYQMIDIYRKTGRKDQLIELVEKMESKCPNLVGAGSMSTSMKQLGKVSAKLDPDSPDNMMNNPEFEKVCREQNLSEDEKKSLMLMTREFVEKMRFMGGGD